MHKHLVLIGTLLVVMAAPCFAQAEKGQTASGATTTADSPSTITDIEKAAWDAFKNKNEAGFRNWVAKDYVGLYADGTANIDAEIADMAKWSFEDISFGDMKVTFPDKNVAVLTYQITLKAIHDGDDASGAYRSSTVFVKRDGKWASVLHTEAEAP